ncbi:MAG: glycoside hydrolase family 97 catalytic domain-containing protein [Bacteroidales bacterium]
MIKKSGVLLPVKIMVLLMSGAGPCFRIPKGDFPEEVAIRSEHTEFRFLDELFATYNEWGVAGVKFGFVNVGSQRWTTWLHRAIREAAKNRIMVDIHDEYRPTGYSRTYPNLMTMEGIRGDEATPSTTQTLTTLFTRMLAGAGDNTICYYSNRVDKHWSHAFQLAKTVCIYSPWQFLFWYDRPVEAYREEEEVPDARVIRDEPELEFFKAVPTVWDETRIIRGSIGEYAIIARRSGKEWYIGGMNSDKDRAFEIPLEFLGQDKDYVAHIYFDDPTVNTRTKVRIKRTTVDAETVLDFNMKANGGQAVRLVPDDATDDCPLKNRRIYSFDLTDSIYYC